MENSNKIVSEQLSNLIDSLIDKGVDRAVTEGSIISDKGELITAEHALIDWNDQMKLLQLLNAIRVAWENGKMHDIYYLINREHPDLIL